MHRFFFATIIVLTTSIFGIESASYQAVLSGLAETRVKKNDIKVVRDSLTQYISRCSSIDKKTKKIKFKGLDPQEFSRKDRFHGETFFDFIGNILVGSSSTMLPKKRIEKKGFWIVPCFISWAENGAINDGETAVCISKNAVWSCYKEWVEEREKRN